MRGSSRVVALAVLVVMVVALYDMRGGLAFAQQQPSGKLVLVSWGGQFQEAQRKAYFEPFQRTSGVQVVEDTGPTLERVQAEVTSGHPSFDVTEFDLVVYYLGAAKNLWEPIDYKYFASSDLKAMPAVVRQKYGVGTLTFTDNIAFSTAAFPDGKPQPNSWADLWDVKKFPGKRAMPYCDLPDLLPEGMLMADGVAPDKVYPVDIPRAIKKLQELSPNVIWYKNLGQPAQLLVTGEASMALAPSGRIQQLIDKGAPLKLVWNQAVYVFDLWLVLRGSPNRDNAMKFVAFASRPKPQADLARLIGYAPTNPRAYQFLDTTTAKKLATYPENFKQVIAKDSSWWKDNQQKWTEACTSAIVR